MEMYQNNFSLEKILSGKANKPFTFISPKKKSTLPVFERFIQVYSEPYAHVPALKFAFLFRYLYLHKAKHILLTVWVNSANIVGST